MKKLFFVFIWILINNDLLLNTEQISAITKIRGSSAMVPRVEILYNSKDGKIITFNNDRDMETYWEKLVKLMPIRGRE